MKRKGNLYENIYKLENIMRFVEILRARGKLNVLSNIDVSI